MEENKELVYNAIKTPDGTILESKHQHDFQMYKDKNGEIYTNDGGTEYLKRSTNKEPYEDLSLYTTDSIEILREHCSWGTYGKYGTGKLTFKKIKDLSNAHLEYIIDSAYKGIIKRELEYRLAKGIFDKDENKDNTDTKGTQNTFKDIYRCDINKPCAQYCSSNKPKCGILMKKLLGEEVKREKGCK